jgi:hypothetical protein
MIATRCVARASRLAGGVLLLLAQVGAAPATAPRRAVVIELFTSQGCSSCPPADRLLTRLAAEGMGIVPLAFHVDYWDRAGWRDPFSSHDWSQRQVAYSRALGLTQVYTPQAVIDGTSELVGSEEQRVRAAISAAASRPAATISLEVEPRGSKLEVVAEVERPEPLRGNSEDLMLAVYETGLVTAVASGENGGRTLHNDYVVRSLRRAAKISPGDSPRTRTAVTLALEKEWNRSALGLAAFLQDPGTLAIRGAAALPLPAPEPARP